MNETTVFNDSVANWKRNIALFMAGQGLSLFGTMLVHYAVMWHITLKTQSGVMIALMVAAGALPMFFISPFAGVWADRYNKKYLICIADASIAVVTLAMAVAFSLGLDLTNWLLLCLVVRALGQGVQTPAVNSMIPQLAPKEHLTRVNGLNGSIQSVVLFASPMAGGALLAVAPIQTLLFIDVVTAVIGIGILLSLVKTPTQAKSSERQSGAGQYFLEISEGLKYVRSQAFVKKLMLLNAFFNIMIAPAAVLTPLQVVRDWGEGVWRVLGKFPLGLEEHMTQGILRDWLETLWNSLAGLPYGPELRLASIEVVFFIGMIIGGLVMGIWGGFKNKSHSMALAICLFGISAAMLGILTNFWWYLTCMWITGLVMSMFNAPLMAMIQTNVEAAYMGRVFSVLTMISSLMMPLGMILWGPLGDAVAIDWLLIGTGLSMFLMGFIFIFDKTLLRAGEPHS